MKSLKYPPKMSKSLLISLSFVLLLSLPCSLSQNPNPNPSSAHGELKSSGFPAGLLPANVASFSFNRTSGDFTVLLDGHCRLTLPPNYLAAYSKQITGKFVDGKIAELNGIRVRAFFRWWSISGIRLSGDNLVIEVGVASAKFPARKFDKIPQCNGRGPREADS